MRSLGLDLAADQRLAPHRHSWHQLVHATKGVMTVDADGGSWVVPPERAVWIPAEFEHSVRTTGRVRMRTLYLRPDALDLPTECCVIQVGALLRELVLEALRLGMLREDVPEHRRLAGVLVDRITRTRAAPLRIRFPSDPRARRVADAARADLAETRSLPELVQGSGASVRTVERLFVQETGLTFGRWRQHVKALHALERLAAGDSVTQAGLAVGYDSTSAFIAMFKRMLGTTPGSWLALK